MEQQKKMRGENWSSEEKEILPQLIAESASIIEDKSTKTYVNIKKAKEWKIISNKFNELIGKHRSETELKLAWKRMKLTAKANLSEHRRKQMNTGGGEKPPSPSTEDQQIIAIAPHDFAFELNDYDSDAVAPVTMAMSMAQDPKPGPSYENIEAKTCGTDAVVQVTSNYPFRRTEATRSPQRRKKTVQKRNMSEEMRLSIVRSNEEYKKRQLEIMEVEHKNNNKIAELKIKKLHLEISLLENKLANKQE